LSDVIISDLTFRISRYGVHAQFSVRGSLGISISQSELAFTDFSQFAVMHCCIIRASSLPDKEFRYHRTVIVTAAVHRGFDWRLSRTSRGHPRN